MPAFCVKKGFVIAALLLLSSSACAEGRSGDIRNAPVQAMRDRTMAQDVLTTMADKATITPTQARECIRKRFSRFLQEIGEEHLSFRMGDIVAETPDAYIIEGYLVPRDDAEERHWGAVHKVSGRCGIIHPPLGPRIPPQFLSNFSWERWQVSF